MADKKSWRDYSKKYNSSKTETEDKKTDSEQKTKSWRDYSNYNSAEVVGKEVTSKVNKWLEGYNSYVTDYQKRYEGRKGTLEDSYVSDSAEWLTSTKERKNALNEEADAIMSYLDQYGGHLDAKFVENVRKTIRNAKNTQLKIVEGATKDNEYWSSFGTEELLKDYGTAEEAYKYHQRTDGYYKEHEGKSSEELKKAAEALEDGEEKKWLESYAASVDYDEKSKADTGLIQQEIEELGNFYDEAYTIDLWYNEYQMGHEPYDAHKMEVYNKLVNEYGGDVDQVMQAINDKKAYIEDSNRIKELNTWSAVTGNEDFATNSGYVSTENNSWHSGLTSKFGMGYDDLIYEYINGKDNGMRSEIVGEAATWRADTEIYDVLDQMKDDEISVYNYYYATEGKEKADEYLSVLNGTLKARKYAESARKAYEYANKNWYQGVIGSIGSVATSLLSGFEYVGDLIDYGAQKLTGQDAEMDKNELAIITNSTRQGVSDQVDWKVNSELLGIKDWDAFDFLYNTAMSGADSLASTAFGGGAGVVLGLSAAAQGTNDALERGMSSDQAFWNGLFSGAFEGLFESVSIGNFRSLKEVPAKTVKDVFKNLGKSMLVNASEEAATEIANIAYDTLINGEFANYTLEELKNGAWKQALMQVFEAGASGALMGVGMGAIANTSGYVKNKKADNAALKQYGDKTDALINEGLGNDVNTESYKLAQEYKQQTDDGKALTGEQIRNLLAANQEQISNKTRQKIKETAVNRLAELGQTEDVSKIAELVVKRVTGQELSKTEKSVLARSQYGAQVAKDMLPQNITSEDIGKILNEIVNGTGNPAVYKSLEDRVGEETKLSVSESGKATISGTDQVIDLSKPEIVEFVRDKKSGKVTDMVLNVDGRQVKASEIDYADENQAYLFEAVSKIENITPGDAQAIVRSYDPSSGLSVGEYLNGMDEAYTYGYHGYSEADMGAGNFAPKLSSKDATSAYLLGQAAKKNINTGKSEDIKRMRTAVEAEAEKAMAEGKEAPKAKDMTITYNAGNGKVVNFDEAGLKLTTKQKAAPALAKIFHEMGLGTNFEFYASFKKKGVRVYLDENGVVQKAPSGVYRKADGTIRIDLNAYNGKGLTLDVMAHELTHFIQQWSDEKYQALADFLIKTYEKTDMTMHQRVLREQARLQGVRGKEISYNEAFDEVVANAMSKMLSDGNVMERLNELKAQDMDLAQKLWEGLKKLLNKFFRVYEKESALFLDAADLMDLKAEFEQMQKMWAEAFVEASENFQAAQTIGFEMDMETESVSPAVMHSEQTWTESDYVQQRDKAAQEIAKAIGVSEKKAKDYIDSVNSIAKMIAEDRSRLDYFSSPGRSSFVDNAEYGGSFDFSTLCKKRRLLTGTFTAIQKALPNTALTADEILDIRNRMKKANLEVSCGLCYVEGSRANMGQFAKEFLRLYKQYYPDAWQPNMADVNTPDGIEWVRINHPECYEQYEYFWNHYGTLKEGDKNLFASQQKPKLYQLHTEYKGEILNKFKADDKVEDKNLNGGISLQSFSDFEIVHLIDTMQIIMDMSRVGLAGQAYTKVPDFAWALGDTGLKINLSLIAKGVDANGKLIFDDVEGMPIADAMKLRDRYSKNVGTILVAFNDEQLLAAMADDRVDFIIPFHRSQWKKSQYEAMGLPAKTKDYTFMQNEKFIKPTYHEYRGRMVKDKATNYMPNEYWDFSKSGKENAEAYLEMCARNNKRPKFYKLLQNNGDGSYSLKADGSTDGYWKLLIDFKMYDNDGNGSPQMAVKPDFNMEEATRMLNDYSGGHSNFPVAQGIVDGFVKDYKDSHKGEMYSSQETDLDTDADSDYDSVGFNDIKDAIKKGVGIKWNNGNVLKLDGAEYAAVVSRISTQYRSMEHHGGVQYIERSTDGKDAKFFLYLFVDHGFDSYEIIARLDYAKQDELIHELRRMIQNGRETARVSASSGGLRTFYGNADRSGNSSPNGGIKNADDKKNSGSRGQRSTDNGPIGLADSGRLDEGSNGTRGVNELFSSQETDFDNVPTFYSRMGKVVEGMKQEKFGASSVISMLRGRGVKAEEIRWSGIQAFLEGKKSVTKADLQEFIKGSMLQIEEETRSGTGEAIEEFASEWQRLMDYELPRTQDMVIDDEFVAEAKAYLESSVEDEDISQEDMDHLMDLVQKAKDEGRASKWHQYKLDGGDNYRELVFKMPGSDYSNMAMQTHWGEDAQGVLAHARIQDFNTFIGKMLFIEEIQSDWHNEGRKEGYRKEGEKTDLMLRRESKKAYEEFYAAVEKMVYDNASWEDDNAVYYVHPVAVAEMFEGNESHFDQYGFTDEQREIIRSMVVEEAARQEAMKTAPKHESVPDAPFKKNYHEYVLKRLLRMAAEQGYDSIGWTTAETQDDRWQNNLPHKEGTGKSGFLKGYANEYDQNIKGFLSDFGEQWGATVGKTTLDNGTEVWSMAITDAMQQSVLKEGQELYSTQETDNISNRDLLANAFEGIVNGSDEYRLIQQYKGRIKILNEYEEKLSKLNKEIYKLTFGTEGVRDTKRIKELQDKAKEIAGNIDKNDKKLIALEASKPLRDVIERERKKASQKTREHVKEIQQNKKNRAEQTELRHKIRKAIRDLDKILNRGNKKQNVKEDMKGFVSKALELADYLFTDHVSNDDLIRKGITVRMTPKEAALVKETEDILSQLYDNADSLTDEEFTRLDAKRKANEEKLRDLLTSQRNERLNTPVYNLFNDLVTEYASLKNSKQDAVKAAYDEVLENSLRSFMGDEDRVKILKNMRVADMTTEELNWLHRAYTMVLTNVRNANKFHAKGKAESIDQVVTQIVMDFGSRKIPEKKLAIAAQKLSNKIGWDYEKLYYALDRIGSDAFTELIMNIADSENIVMQDIIEAAEFRDEIVKKYGFNNWDVNKKIDREFLDHTGKKFKLTLGQLMSLYAYSRRAGAWDHIEYGGFVFSESDLTDPKPADSYKLSKEQCDAITSLLTKEQKGYVEDMQKFLSETMGAKGNEVSMQLYGIKMFNEKNYFPVRVSGDFKPQANESQAKAAQGFQSMSNAGFTHAQNPSAKAPFMLDSFNNVWADHVNEMSRYHGTVPALEDLRRVMNRSSYSENTSESTSVQVVMKNHFGEEAWKYFDNLYKEANSGAITDRMQSIPKKLLSMFRKNSVAYSLSVLVQQPASVVRAYAMIDRKYFGFKGFGTITSGVAKAVSSKWNNAYANAYNEMLKYAPGVTMAKEIGGFDTATGGSIRSYLLDTNKSIKQKLETGNALEKGKALLDGVDDNAVANLPNVADKIAWIEIWNACKRETVATHKDLAANSEEFMQVVGERFTEVIRATQVYDSIFAKSPMLKSKNLSIQYLVSFMNEPNTVANMMEKAMRDLAKGNKADVMNGLKTAHVVIHSIIFTNVLKSIIYAMRDDDEDETYIEKYIEAITGNMMSDINPLNYIPIARDVWSIAQGYDVERADMAIVADALDALDRVLKNANTDKEDMTDEQLIEFDKKVIDANWKLVESVAAFFGIPVKNIRREVNAIFFNKHAAAGQETALSISNTVYDAVVDSIPFMSGKPKQDKIYDAKISGDNDYLERLKSTYKTDASYNTAVRKALRENDPRIHEAAQARYDGNTEEYKRIFREVQSEGKFTWDEIMDAVNSEENAIKNKLEPDKVTGSYNASDFVQAVAMGDTGTASAARDDIISTHVANGKSQKEAEKEFASAVKSSTKDAYSGGLLDKAGAENMLVEYADMDEEEAASRVNYWAFCEDNPEYADVFTESHVAKYHEWAEPLDISVEVYAQFITGTKGLETIKDEWGDEVESVRDQVLDVIDSLPLTWQQKDALYLAYPYAESQIWDVPW